MTLFLQAKFAMNPDNHWHDAVCVKHKDGSFGIYHDQKDAVERGSGKINNTSEFQEVKYNWNHGQPIVDYGDFQMTITDITRLK